jgi:hypothetical protein
MSMRTLPASLPVGLSLAAARARSPEKAQGTAAVGANPPSMTTKDEPDRRLSALVAALSLNRGELDAGALERLLRLTEPKPAAPAKS